MEGRAANRLMIDEIKGKQKRKKLQKEEGDKRLGREIEIKKEREDRKSGKRERKKRQRKKERSQGRQK